MKKLALLIVAIACAFSVNAQQSKSDASVEFRPHWDLQLQGGVGYTIGETSFGKLLSPSINLSTNYRFHHAMGVRFGLGGFQGKGAIVNPDEGYSFDFLQVNADYKLDLTSLIGGYNHKRPVAFYLLAGVGFNYGFNNDEANAIDAQLPGWATDRFAYLWDKKAFVAGRFGLGADFRVGERVLLNLEANANVLSDHFNSKRAENADWQFNLLAGVTVAFGPKSQTSQAWVEEQEAIARAEKEREEREARLAEEKAAEEKRIAEEKAAEEKRIAEEKELEAKRLAAAVRAENIAAHSEDIFFTIGSSYIRKAELEKLNRIAEWLKANPDYRVDVVGYADKETGTATGNLKLSERRAQNVRKALIAAGVEEARIDMGHKGDTEQPFEKNHENRVVICTLE